MTYYDDPDHVEEYIAMSEGYDGAELIEQLKPLLPAGKQVLELGMGPGRDLDILAQTYDAIGSDGSEAFLQHYRLRHPDTTLLTLDAAVLQTDIKVDAIYSNKVLHLLTPAELRQSLSQQTRLLNDNGLVLHSFWRGDSEETFHGVYSAYYQADPLTQIFAQTFELLKVGKYTEMEMDDSLWIVARKRPA